MRYSEVVVMLRDEYGRLANLKTANGNADAVEIVVRSVADIDDDWRNITEDVELPEIRRRMQLLITGLGRTTQEERKEVSRADPVAERCNDAGASQDAKEACARRLGGKHRLGSYIPYSRMLYDCGIPQFGLNNPSGRVKVKRDEFARDESAARPLYVNPEGTPPKRTQADTDKVYVNIAIDKQAAADGKPHFEITVGASPKNETEEDARKELPPDGETVGYSFYGIQTEDRSDEKSRLLAFFAYRASMQLVKGKKGRGDKLAAPSTDNLAAAKQLACSLHEASVMVGTERIDREEYMDLVSAVSESGSENAALMVPGFSGLAGRSFAVEGAGGVRAEHKILSVVSVTGDQFCFKTQSSEGESKTVEIGIDRLAKIIYDGVIRNLLEETETERSSSVIRLEETIIPRLVHYNGAEYLETTAFGDDGQTVRVFKLGGEILEEVANLVIEELKMKLASQ